MGKILACIAVCLVCVAGWQHSQTQAEDPVLCAISGSEVDSVEEQLRVEYPALFKRNTVVTFGRKDCRWCPAQKAHLQALAARGYRVAYFDATKHEMLYDFMRGDEDALPLTVVFVDGKVQRTFIGLTYWRKLAAWSQDCKVKRKNSIIDITIGPDIWIRI